MFLRRSLVLLPILLVGWLPWRDGAASLLIQPTNLLPNPSLESGTGPYPDGWTLFAEPDHYDQAILEWEWTQGQAHSGQRAFKIGYWYDGRWHVSLRTASPISVSTDQKYVFSFWYRTEGVIGSETRFAIKFLPSGRKLALPLEPSADWRQARYLLDRFPPGTTQVLLEVGQVERAPIWLWVDDLDFHVATPQEIADRVGKPADPGDPPVARATGPLTTTATGRVHIEQAGGAWWLVDPRGRPLWSSGSVVAPPSDDNPTLQQWALDNGYTDRSYLDEAWARLSAWGFATIAGWSDNPDLKAVQDGHQPWGDARPQFSVINFCEHAPAGTEAENRWGERKDAPGHRFPDPFHPDWQASLAPLAQDVAARFADRPWRAGYFTDNEMNIVQAFRYVYNPNGAGPAFRDWLYARYNGNIQALNGAWTSEWQTVNLSSFDDILTVKPEPVSWRDPMLADFLAFEARLWQEYATRTLAAIRAADPDALAIGPRVNMGQTHESLRLAAALSDFDAVAVNVYPTNWPTLGLSAAQKSWLTAYQAAAGRPLIVGETSVPALDSGLYETELLDWSWDEAVDTQAERARAAAVTFAWLAGQPWTLGAHWFTWADYNHPDPNRRRANRGLVDSTNTRWAETVAALKAVNREIACQNGLPACRDRPRPLAVRPQHLADDFESGLDAWYAEQGGGSVSLSPTADTPDGSARALEIAFSGDNTWQYATYSAWGLGERLAAIGAVRLRFDLKGDGQPHAGDSLRLQLREGDGDRWDVNLGTLVQNATEWTEVVIPLTDLVPEGTWGDGVFELQDIASVRFKSHYAGSPATLRVDNLRFEGPPPSTGFNLLLNGDFEHLSCPADQFRADCAAAWRVTPLPAGVTVELGEAPSLALQKSYELGSRGVWVQGSKGSRENSPPYLRTPAPLHPRTSAPQPLGSPAPLPSGTLALRLTFDGTTDPDFWHVTQGISVTPGITLTLGAWLRAESLTQPVWLEVRGGHGPHQWSVASPSVVGTTDWQWVQMTFTVPDEVGRLTVGPARVAGGAPISGILWVDGVALCALPDGAEFVDLSLIQAAANHWHSRWGTPGFEGQWDWDGDGEITVVDVMQLAARWESGCR